MCAGRLTKKKTVVTRMTRIGLCRLLDHIQTTLPIYGLTKVSFTKTEEVCLIHFTAILYARATSSFQARYLQLRTPASNLGALASSSTVSLPVVRSISPNPSTLSRKSSTRSTTKKRTVRGPAPPSSFSMARMRSRGGTSRYSLSPLDAASESETDDDMNGDVRSRSSMSVSSTIGRPISRNGHAPSSQNTKEPPNPFPASQQSDKLSVVSSSDTIHAPYILRDISPSFFEATLDFLYTAEENMVDVIEFLYDDSFTVGNGVEERLDKLRQDLVFMWRSKLYSDVEIIIGENSLRTIPDVSASAVSLVLDEESEEEENAKFSAHKMILASRSPYFAAQLLSPYADSKASTIRLPSPPFTPAAMHFTLGFLYSGTLFFSNRTFDLSTAFQIWLAGSYLQVETLQSLVSSLISQDFCHGFMCSPPCKSCVKRIPRTLAFTSRPDVSDVFLQTMAQKAVCGEYFGSFWSKEIGKLDQASRQSIVTDICATVDLQAGFTVTALRQLSIVGSRIDVERHSVWVESLRWMCETVQNHVSTRIQENLEDVVSSREWGNLIQGIGFLNDVLGRMLSLLVENLSVNSAAKNYEVLVGNVLLCEENLPTGETAAILEEARRSIIRYLSKRWVNVREVGGFNGLQQWVLQELAGEIDVPAKDLVQPNPVPKFIPGSKHSPWVYQRPNKPVHGGMIDGEREAGPIHLRAAVLNRNAARTSASIGKKESVTSASHFAAEPTGMSAVPHRRSTASSAKGPINTDLRAGRIRKASNSSTASQADSFISSKTNQSINTNGSSKTLSVKERRSIFESKAKDQITPTKTTSSNLDIPQSKKHTKERQFSTTTTDTSERDAPSDHRTQDTSSDLTYEGHYDRSQDTPKASKSRQYRNVESKGKVPLYWQDARRTSEAVDTPDQIVPMSLDTPSVTDATFMKASQTNEQVCVGNETKLTLGVPCVIAPTTRSGSTVRLKATVKYIGPLDTDVGPFIGVELSLPQANARHTEELEFCDGIYKGRRYYNIDMATTMGEYLRHKSEREARFLLIEQALREGGVVPRSLAQIERHTDPSTHQFNGVKRRKDMNGTGQTSDIHDTTLSRGLFVRPNQVLWVIV